MRYRGETYYIFIEFMYVEEQNIVGVKKILSLFVSNIIILTGCGKGEILENDIHNEVVGLYTSVSNSVYYVSNNVLFQYTSGNKKELSSNVETVQKQGDIVYCVCTENHIDYSLYQVVDDKLEWVFDLNSGTYQQSILYDNRLYTCINNEITVYDLQTRENEKLPIENKVTRFAVDGNNLYYWSINFSNSSFDDYINSIKNNNEIFLFKGDIYSYDLNINATNKLASSFSEEDLFFISPTEYGVVFYNPETSSLNIYDESVETLYNANILSMTTDNKNVYFSTSDHNVYQLDVITKDIDVLFDDVNIIKGMDNRYIFDGYNCVLMKD